MTSSLVRPLGFSLLLAILQISIGLCQDSSRERVAILPFEIRGITPEEGLQLRQRLAETLGESPQLDILPPAAMKSILESAGLKNIDSCNTLPCLAQLGKVLDVGTVVHVSVDRWRERFVMHSRLVRASDAALLYNERVDYSGDFNTFLSTVILEQGRRLTGARYDTGSKWYLVAAAVLVGVGVIYWIYTSFAKSSITDPAVSGPPTQQ